MQDPVITNKMNYFSSFGDLKDCNSLHLYKLNETPNFQGASWQKIKNI